MSLWVLVYSLDQKDIYLMPCGEFSADPHRALKFENQQEALEFSEKHNAHVKIDAVKREFEFKD